MKRIVWFHCLVATFLIVGCASNEQYRTNFDAAGGDQHKAVIETTKDYSMGFVEFDDQGAFWCDQQRTAVEHMVMGAAGIDPDHPGTPQGIVLVAFVPGWKDNAAYDNDGVKAFRSILKQLSEGEKFQAHPARKVVGVYVGWRGLTAEWEPFKELTFWDRKDTAHKVGAYGGLTQLLVDLENIQKQSLKSLKNSPDQPRTELVIIGHSMGAGAVYSALSQIIIERFADSLGRIDLATGKPNRTRLKPLGDQIILLNPAFEAQRYWDLHQMAQPIEKFPSDQRPVLSIFTSEGDWATHYVFPTGQFFSMMFQSNRSTTQSSAGRDSVGWYDDFRTHKLTYKPNAKPTTRGFVDGKYTRAAQESNLNDQEEVKDSVNRVDKDRDRSPGGIHPQQPLEFYESELTAQADFKQGYPFVVASLDTKIMNDHTDITNPVLIKFLRDYIQFCQVKVGDHEVK